MQYGQQDAYGQQAPYATGIYSPGGTYAAPPAPGPYLDSAYAASSPASYGPQPYATDAYGQAIVPSPSSAVMSPTGTYDPGYANYMYGLQTPRSPRRYAIQAPTRPNARMSTETILTVLIVCGTLFLVLLAMMIIVTVVVPRLARQQRYARRRGHEFPVEQEKLADAEMPVEARQVSEVSEGEQAKSKLDSAGAKHGSKQSHKNPGMGGNVKGRAKG